MTTQPTPLPDDPPGAHSTRQPIVKVRNLTAAYGPHVVLRDINFNVYPGEVFVILGGSGCGKSTLLKHMIGLYQPVKGKVELAGDNIVGAAGHRLRKILRKIGVAYQSGAMFGSLTLLENVRLPLEEFTSLPRPAMDLVACMKLRLVGLEDAGDRMPSELSGGMIKRAAIARAMVMDPQILFLDEPSAGLDPITSAELDQLIKSLARDLGMTFIIVSHELASIYAIADRVIMLEKDARTIVAEGRPAELRDHSDNPWVRQFFNRQAD